MKWRQWRRRSRLLVAVVHPIVDAAVAVVDAAAAVVAVVDAAVAVAAAAVVVVGQQDDL